MLWTHRVEHLTEIEALAGEWDALATSPFHTFAWLRSWEDVFGDGRSAGVVVRGDDGRLAATAWLPRSRPSAEPHAGREIRAATVLARDLDAGARAWQELLLVAPASATFPGLPSEPGGTDLARTALRSAGYHVFERPGDQNPYLALPPTMDALLAAVSRNTRSQTGRRRRALEQQGSLTLITHTDGSGLDAVLALEAGGWKGRGGTAITSVPESERHFRLFAERAAATGALRIHLLELDGRAIAGDIGVVVGPTAFLLKTGYDESLAAVSPGLVLRAMVLEAMISEGLTGYDFLGGAESYKTRWGAIPRPLVNLHASRGPLGAPRWAWHGHVRPALVPLAKRILRRGGPESAPA